MDTITIKDIGVAATLACHGAEVLGMDVEWKGKKSQPTGHWAFEKSPAVDAIIEAYDRKDASLTVNPWAFRTHMRDLKERAERAGSR